MSEASKLQKLNAAAQAEANRGSLPSQFVGGMLIILLGGLVLRWDLNSLHHVRFELRWVVWGVAIAMPALAVLANRRADEIKLGRSPACENEREQVERWIAQSKVKSSDIIQFTADDFHHHSSTLLGQLTEDKSAGRVLIRLFVEDRWIVMANFHEESTDKVPTLTIFDAHSTTILYSPEHKRLQVGNCRFRMVDFTPELTVLAKQLAHQSAPV